ncbi:nuclear transport factor 2 family protein [Amycolatopsis tolypomycina]|nr:nuclear transport factor 2 family protein [Amycolatopsis tolypomycina]
MRIPAMSHACISEALQALLFEPDLELHQVLDQYYAPDYTHRSDGKTLNRDEFAKVIRRVRSEVTGGAVTVLDELCDGVTYAERHTICLSLADGSLHHREIAVFGTFAEDGRFRRLSESGFDIDRPDQAP